MSSDPVSVWIAQLKDGRREAVGQLMARYFRRLVGLAHTRLGGRPGLAADDEDVALSAFKGLCLGAEGGRSPRLEDRDDLWRLLATITVRKALNLMRRRPEQAAREEDLEQFLGRDPPPEVAAELAEEHRRMLDRLGDPDLQAVALWKVEGLSNEEIAERLGCVVRTVERRLHVIRLLWADEATE